MDVESSRHSFRGYSGKLIKEILPFSVYRLTDDNEEPKEGLHSLVNK